MSNNKQSSVDKEFVPYEEALALKQLGFNEPCLAAYYVFGDGKVRDGYYGQTEPELFINGIGKELEDRMEELKMFAYCSTLVPTFSQAFRFFRENHNLHYEIEYNGYEYLGYVSGMTANIFKTFEEAELKCLKRLIKILQGGNK